MMMKANIRVGLCCLCLLLFIQSACVTVKSQRLQAQVEKSNCNQENKYSYTPQDIPTPIYQLEVDTALTSRFSRNEINAANAIGMLDMLTQYIQALKAVQQNNTVEKRLALLEWRQKINHSIDLASLEISAVTAELDCEEEKIAQIASFLKEKEDETESKLTVGSIILGAVSAIATGIIIKDNNAANVIGVGVGLADATFGILMLTNQRNIEIRHSRNVLREIWQATETSSIYPPSIWYFLNYYNPKEPDKPSLRSQLIESWKSFGQISASKGKTNNSSIEIYFSEGGKYTTAQLENRANMYDQLESAIKLMKQELRTLSQKIAELH